MKVALSNEASTALTSLLERLRKGKSDIGKSHTIAVNQLILEFTETAQTGQIESLQKRLISPKQQRSNLLKRIALLTANADSETIQALEKGLNKIKTVDGTMQKQSKNRMKSGTLFDEKTA